MPMMVRTKINHLQLTKIISLNKILMVTTEDEKKALLLMLRKANSELCDGRIEQKINEIHHPFKLGMT